MFEDPTHISATRISASSSAANARSRGEPNAPGRSTLVTPIADRSNPPERGAPAGGRLPYLDLRRRDRDGNASAAPPPAPGTCSACSAGSEAPAPAAGLGLVGASGAPSSPDQVASCGCDGESRGNSSIVRTDAAPEPKPDHEVRDSDAGPLGPCGPGTSNPFCLPIPSDETPCAPFADHNHALSVWSGLSHTLPAQLAAVTGCSEVKPVWEEYFSASSRPFHFAPGSGVAEAAKRDPTAAAQADTAAIQLFKGVKENLPSLLRSVQPNPLDPSAPPAPLRLPLDQAISAGARVFLHPLITFNTPTNAAANLAGDVGKDGQGSDVFGDDDRALQGTVVIEVRHIDAVTGTMSGELRWVPRVHVKDTVDFCPGNLGNAMQRPITLPLSKLEAAGLTRDVPISIDYDLELRKDDFSVAPKIGPMPPPSPDPNPQPPGPHPGPVPPGPHPGPVPDKPFPRSGPAKTTGTLLRVRTGPSLHHPTLRLIEHTGTPIQVETQVRGDDVGGNDVWNKIADGYISDRYVAFDDAMPK